MHIEQKETLIQAREMITSIHYLLTGSEFNFIEAGASVAITDARAHLIKAVIELNNALHGKREE